MKVEVNGSPHNVEPDATIANLLEQLHIDLERGVAVALNYNVVSKSKFANTALKEGDQLEIIHATAGG
jgi:sulfur carrier protein